MAVLMPFSGEKSIGLGETSSDAYRGDRGKVAYDHSQSDHSDITPAFTESNYRTNIASGNTIAVILGRIKKWFSDLQEHAFWSLDGDTLALGTDGSDGAVYSKCSKVTYDDTNNQLSIETKSDYNASSIVMVPIPTKTSDLTNDSGYVTENNKVTQTATSTNTDYEVLFSGTADNTTRIEGARKNTDFKYNPSTGNLQVTKLNGVTIGSSPKFTDTTYSLVGANGTTGLIKNGSSVTSSSGYTACPIISGVPYYKDTNTTTGTSYNAGSCPDNATFATNGSVARAYSALNSNLQAIYPVGAVYMSTNSTLPTWIANLGTWTELDAGRFLKAVGSEGTTGNANAVNTGGTSITQAQLPAGVAGYINMHNAATSTPIHNVSGVFSSKQTNNNYAAPTTTVGGAQSVGIVYFDLGGKGNTHNHTPGAPASYGLHVWVRTA